jgi:hypothetical protein
MNITEVDRNIRGRQEEGSDIPKGEKGERGTRDHVETPEMRDSFPTSNSIKPKLDLDFSCRFTSPVG